MAINQVNIAVSIAIKALLGVQIFFVIRWFMVNTEGSHVRTAIKCLQIQATYKDIYVLTMLEHDAMHALNVEKRLQQVLGSNNTLISTVVSNHFDVRFAIKAIPNFPISAATKECMQIVVCRSSVANVDKLLVP